MWAGALALSAPTSVLMAEAATSNDPLLSWLSYGAVGAVAVALALGLLIPKSTYEKALTQLADTQARLNALQEKQDDRVIPGLMRSTLVLEALTPLVQQEIALRAAAQRSPEGGG